MCFDLFSFPHYLSFCFIPHAYRLPPPPPPSSVLHSLASLLSHLPILSYISTRVVFYTSFRYIVVVSTDYDNTQQQPVALETAQKIEETAKLQVNASSQSTSSATMGTVWLASTFGSNSPGDVVDRIARHLGRHKVQRQNAVFLIDEVMDDKFRAVAKKLRIKYPDSFIWTAGPWPSEKPSQFMVGTCRFLTDKLTTRTINKTGPICMTSR